MASLVKSTKRRANIIFYKGLQKIKGEWTLLNSFYDKNIKIRQKAQKRNCRPVSPVNIDTKIFNKILLSQSQKHIKDYIPQPSGIYWNNAINIVNFASRIKEGKTHMIISIDAEEALDKIQCLSW